ncbi:Probable 3-hydroxybutyryl-CoA dehydrogenase [Serratia fonticola]|uniref:Probable 3-hydroxybutyryl-CoA dehydrogenase n=1 Tax=Serratia fonticola TaxID=47917 RepID=A0A4U9WM53_SERFO|nr:Probable 3-hydroxybutyryl-CoA dehydrogenase [Serratia fonticola]
MVLFDLSVNYQHAPVIAISSAEQNTVPHTAKVIRLLQSLGKQVIHLPDYPGLLVMRTVAMLANEALDVVNKGVANAADTDDAMRFGVNYPQGPLAWGSKLGWQQILTTLEKPATLLRGTPLSAQCRCCAVMPPIIQEPNADECQHSPRAGPALRRTDV